LGSCGQTRWIYPYGKESVLSTTRKKKRATLNKKESEFATHIYYYSEEA